MSSRDINSGLNEMNAKEEMLSGDELGEEFIQDLYPTDTQNEIEIKHEALDCQNITSTSDAEYNFYGDPDIKTMSNILHVDCSSVKFEGNDLNELCMTSGNQSARILIERLRSTHGSSQPTEDPLRIDHDSPPFDQSSFNHVKCEVDEDMDNAEYSELESKLNCESYQDFELEKKVNENDPDYTPSSRLTQNVSRRGWITNHNTSSDEHKSKNVNEGFPSSQELLKCFECGERLSTNADLIMHMRTHISLKSHKCDVCEWTFARRGCLTRHKLIHTGEKPYTCDVCQKGFALTTELTRHKKLHNGERPFKCGECEKSFQWSNHLTNHKRIHTGERHFKCDVCLTIFSKKYDLTVHRKTHNGERPFKCDECEKSFVRPAHLSTHKRIHTTGKKKG